MLADAAPVLEPGDFFRDAHARIYDHCRKLAARGDVIDLVTLNHSLAGAGELDAVNGPAYIASLIDGVPRARPVRVDCRTGRQTDC
jgi:replicative DNA helicase